MVVQEELNARVQGVVVLHVVMRYGVPGRDDHVVDRATMDFVLLSRCVVGRKIDMGAGKENKRVGREVVKVSE